MMYLFQTEVAPAPFLPFCAAVAFQPGLGTFDAVKMIFRCLCIHPSYMHTAAIMENVMGVMFIIRAVIVVNKTCALMMELLQFLI